MMVSRPTAITARWTRSAGDRAAIQDGCWFDLAAAARVREFARTFLRHSKGEWAGRPFTLLPWQWQGIIGPLFGWRRADGTRRFRRGYIEVPKKNGKSTLAALVSLYLLVADSEPGAEIYAAANDREQAGIVYGEAERMVRASIALSSELEIVPSKKRIVWASRNSFYQALSADVPTKEGVNLHGLVFDELHALRQRGLWDALEFGGAARRQPLQLAITTAGWDRNSVCYEQHVHAARVLDGTYAADWSHFAFIAAAAPADDWTSERTWKKANPSWGVTVKPDAFREDFAKARTSLPQENIFRRYRLNEWTEQAVRWLDMDAWAECGGAVDARELAGKECVAGLDLASVRDLTALVLLFERDGQRQVLPHFWLPADGLLEREGRDLVPYGSWVRDGLIELTEGNATDYAVVRRRIQALAKTYRIKQIAYDPWNAQSLANDLAGDGLRLVEFRQTMANLSPPTKELERLVLERKLRHGGNPVLRWMAANAAVRTDAYGNYRPVKPERSSPYKIDGIIATVMALALAGAGDRSTSVYERKELVLL